MNLIICCTPLQSFLAGKIIDLYPNEKFCGIVLTATKNIKSEYYFEQLKKKCVDCIYIHNLYFNQFENINQLSFFFKILFQLYKWKINKNSKFFISSIDKYVIHCLISFIKPKEIYTFDDGTLNIVKSGVFHESFQHFRIRGKILNKIFNINYDLNKIKKESKLHYTIFPNIENIIKNTTPLSILHNQYLKTNHSINLFIGQYINDHTIKIIQNLIKIYGITHYLPHHWENYHHINNVEYINTPLIFEDYFAQNLADKNVTIYTFFSTAALNVAFLPNVKVISIKPKSIKEKQFLEVYDIFKEMGIEVIDYDDSEI